MTQIEVKFESRTAHGCFRIATNCFELAQRATERWEIEHHCTTGIIFTAFSIEALINHFARIYFPNWNIQKGGERTDLHRKVFRAVNLPGYLGTTTYQHARKCFDIRDKIAHGKTSSETTKIPISNDITHEKLVYKITSISPKAFEEMDLQRLKLYLDTAKKIQADIESNGFYPKQEHIPKEQREKLSECPLEVSGIREW